MDDRTDRMSLHGFVAEARAELFSADRGFLYTFGRLLVRPGPTVAAAWRGEDPRLMRPLRYFMVVFSLYTVAFVSTGAMDLLADDFGRNLVDGINSQRAKTGKPMLSVEQVREANPLAFYSTAPLVVELSNVAMLFLAAWAAFARWGINAAERLTLTLYLYATFNLVQVPLVPLVFTGIRAPLYAGLAFLFFGYVVWAAAGLRQGTPVRDAWRGVAWWVGMQVLALVLIGVLGARMGFRMAMAEEEARAAAPAPAVATVPAATATTAPSASPP